MTSLEIAELSVDVRAVTTHERLDALERFVASSVSTRFADALAALEDASGGYPDDVEIFIDRLDVDCSVASSWDGAKVARALAARVHDEIGRATGSGTCLVFRDRAEFVAALIIALADGQASRFWWFDSFTGLALVPASNAVRTVVLDEGEAGIAALTRLTTRDAQRIVGALSREDAARILDRIAVRETSGALSAHVLWECSRDLRSRDDDPNGWLLALIAAERDAKGSAAGRALSALSSFRSLRAFARAAPEVLAAAIASGTPIDALERCGVDAEALRWLDAHMIKEACKGLVEACGDVSMALAHDTPHAGALLLRVVLERTDWRKQWRECVHGFNEAVEDVLAWMIVTRAIASGDARAVRDDVALRLLLPHDSAGCVEELSNDNAIAVEIDNAAASLLREFARRLPGCEGASADWLRTNVLSFGAHVTMHAGTVQAVVGRPPLDVLLVLGGWKRTQCRLADGRVLTLREVPS